MYSSVGFGGGSSYIAVLSLYSLDHDELRAIALICNIVVVTGATVLYSMRGIIPWRKVSILVLVSVPMAFWGGTIRLDGDIYRLLLGVTLLLAAISMWMQPNGHLDQASNRSHPMRHASIGGGIGWLSGLVGIGGGIFLSPLLYLMKWDRAQVIAATSSFFILVNSIAGLAGQMTAGFPVINIERLIGLALAVFVGGQVGSRWVTLRWDGLLIKRLTAILVLYVGLRLLYQSFT